MLDAAAAAAAAGAGPGFARVGTAVAVGSMTQRNRITKVCAGMDEG